MNNYKNNREIGTGQNGRLHIKFCDYNIWDWFSTPKFFWDYFYRKKKIQICWNLPQTTCVYCTAAGTIFGTTDVYELGFSYLSISIFRCIFLRSINNDWWWCLNIFFCFFRTHFSNVILISDCPGLFLESKMVTK